MGKRNTALKKEFGLLLLQCVHIPACSVACFCWTHCKKNRRTTATFSPQKESAATAETSLRPGKVAALSVFSGAEILIFSAAVSFIQCSGWLDTPISKNTTAYYATVVKVIFFQMRNWPYFSRIVCFEGHIQILLLPICTDSMTVLNKVIKQNGFYFFSHQK